MLDKSIDLLKELDSASKIHHLQRDDIDALMLEFATRITATLHIERLSVWVFNTKKDAIISMGEYDTRTSNLGRDTILSKLEYPHYFKALKENKIILAPDILNHPSTKEFTTSYSIPNGICSLMDIPLRIMGELVGVMCFEKCGNVLRNFSEKEQTFAMSLGLVFASNLEARHRRAAQTKLETALKEKELLIKEINHRVKNNFTILISLLRLSKNQGRTQDPKILLDEYEQRIMSMLKIHDLLFQTNNYVDIPVESYLQELIKEFRNSHPEIADRIIFKDDGKGCTLGSRPAINLGLMITEIFLNSVKYAFFKQKDIHFIIELKCNDDGSFIIHVGNTGTGFDFEKELKNETLGLHLIKDMAEEICEKAIYPNEEKNEYEFWLK
jgi:two-component sensor histidine kinase